MSEQKLDEVDGEFPFSNDACRQKFSIKHPDLEKSLTDSGMDEGSNSGSLDTGDNSDDDDVVLRKPKKLMQRILDDDSDMSQDAPVKSEDAPVKSQDAQVKSQDAPVKSQDDPVKSKDASGEQTSQKVPITSDSKFDFSKEVIDLREKRKQEFTPEQALDVIMQDSSEDSDQDDTPAKKKRVKRPVAESSSDEDENISVMDTIKKHSAKTGTEDLFDSEDTKRKEDDGSDSDKEDSQRKVPDNLFNNEQDSDSSECKSSGSEVEKSDSEQGDEGFDESSIDPKLLAKLKKGAAKKPKTRSKRDQLQSIHSESQRLVRESRVNLPYHQPAPRSINDFLERANRKQHEYKVLRGFRDTTKANLMQDILQKARIQTKTKTKEELDKYSDSDEDWNPEEEKEKNLKDRIDERMRKKSGGGMPLGEIKLSESAENSNSNLSSVINEADDTVDDDDLPDIGDSIETNDKDVNKLYRNVENVQNHKQTVKSFRNKNSSDVDLDHNTKDSDVVCGTTNNDSDLECVQNESESLCLNDKDGASCSNGATEQTRDIPDDLLFDWEKDTVSKTVECDRNSDKELEMDKELKKTCRNDADKSDENKENIDPNEKQSEKSNSEQVLTPSRKNKSSPRSSTKKKKNKLAALAGIDLDNVKPCLSGNTDTFVTLEDGVEAPKNPGLQKLMDRLTKHSTKTEKKQKTDTDISIISKDAVGIDKEELKLNTFTYHSIEEETNPLLKLETPGAKLVALKEQLQEKMKERREMARQKRQEVYDLDNEEGGFEEEEAEMSEHSDTDVEEDDDFEEQFGAEEEEEEKETNPFADDEAEDEGDNEEEGNIEDEYEEDNDYSLRLDVTDDEQSEDEEEDNEKKSKAAETDEEMVESVAETEDKPAEFKEPKGPSVPEKPFSIFGKKGRGNSFNETQVPSGQTKTSLTMPIEDSQDLYNSVLPEITHTQGEKPAQQSQDFSFFLEDSQSNMLDADGYLKTKSTGKKKQTVPDIAADDNLSTQNNMDELLGLCSGRFMESQTAGKDKTSRKSLFDESSNTQGNMDELMGLCSGVFTEKSSTLPEKKGTKRTASEVETDEDSITAFSDNEDKLSEKDAESDNEAENNDSEDNAADTDHVDSEGEEEQPKFKGFTLKNKHGKIRQEFVEAEAELSGSEYDSDENLDLPEEEDIMEMEEGDKDAAKIDQNQLRDEVGRIHLKQLIDEDKRELLRYQEMYLPDGDLYSEGGGRVRRFKWSNMEEYSQQDMFNDGSDGEDHQEETDDFTWRKERYEREQFLKQQQEMENNDGDNSQFLKLGKVFLKKQGSVDASMSDKGSKSQDTGAETPGFPGSFYKLPQQKRGSFLARSKEALAKIAEMTKPVVNPSAGAKSSGKFTFQVISPDKEKAAETTVKGKQRKAHVAKQPSKESRDKRPPAKRPKLDTQNSFTENSIFNLI